MSNDRMPNNLPDALEMIRQLSKELQTKDAEVKRLTRLLSTSQPGSVGAPRSGLKEKIARLAFYKSSGGRRSAKKLISSGLFDTDYYLKQCEGREDYALARRNPVVHYLEKGAFEALDPSAEFDSDWYFARNQDVASAGLNPLLHYIEHGRDEGRLPYFGAVPLSTAEGPPKTTTALNRRLWTGFPHIALPQLEDQADALFKGKASWYLAAWLYTHGDFEPAVSRLQQILGRSQLGKRPRVRDVVALAKCFSQLSDTGRLEQLLDEYADILLTSEVAPYLKSNLNRLQGLEDTALTNMNEIFYRAGLNGITRRDPNRALSLSNLAPGERELGSVDYPNPPLISVVVPAFNAEETLSIALDSLLAQTWSHLEVIVVDDGSGDGTASVAKAYEKRDSRVRYLANAQNSGAYPTRNNGMRAARGDFVTVHDSDDWSHPQKLERQILPLLHDDSKVASFSSWVRVSEELRFVGPWLLSAAFVEKNHSSMLMRRELLEECGLWDEVNVAGDTEFLWRLESRYGHRALVSILPNTPLSFALADDNSLTRSKATHVKTIHYGMRRIYRESATWWHRLAKQKAMMHQGERPFPLPAGIKRGANLELDTLFVANWADDPQTLSEKLAKVDALTSQCKKVMLLHWPSYLQNQEMPIADDVFEFCQERGIDFAHMGLKVHAPRIYFLDDELWEHPPTRAVQVEGLGDVLDGNGRLFEPQQKIHAYFSQGGFSDTQL